MTNNFIFESSPNPKPKDKKVGGHCILCPPPPEKVGEHVPRVPHQIAPMSGHTKISQHKVQTW